MTSEESQILSEVRDFVSRFRASLVGQVPAGGFTPNSKLPFKATVLREAYFYRVTELADAACVLYEAGLNLSGVIMTRAAIETTAALYYLKKAVSEYLGEPDIEKLDRVLMAGLSGTRDQASIEHGLPSAINVLTMVRHLEQVVPKIEDNYNWLSEMAHPNYRGVYGAFGKTNEETLTAEFSSGALAAEDFPGRRLLLACLAIFEVGYNELAGMLSQLNASFKDDRQC